MSNDLDQQFAGEQSSKSQQPDLSGVDLSDPQVFGKLFVDSIYKITKVASIYSVDHNQTRIAIDEFMATFSRAVRHSDGDSISIVIRDELAVVNGETLRLRRREQTRLNELRDLFAAGEIRGLVLDQHVQTDQLVSFLGELKRVSNIEDNMAGFEVPNIRIEHGMPNRSIREALSNVNKSMYVAHVYIRGLVKTRNAHKTVREQQSADVPTGVIRRIMQSVSELLGDDDFTILGLLPLRMVPPDLSSHSFNSAIYAMLLADRVGLPPKVVSYVGMAVIYQDLDRLVGISVGQRDQSAGLDTKQQFQSNLRDVAKMLERVQGDVISTLRILLTYERGCDFNKAVSRPFYRSERHLHLVTRIIDLARTYDLLIQGLQGYKQRRPDLAIQYIQSRAGEAFDPTIVELMVSTLGIYPIGTTIQLTSGENAIVIRTPAPSSDPRRPVVRLLDRANPTVIDLSEPRFADIEIAHSIELEADQVNAASEVFLLS
jgi:HD-GYP domain-containing protein (c-di-GMP phosphodiesterase class II)